MYFILYNNYANLSLRDMRRFYMYEGRLCLMVRFRQVLHIFQRTLVSFSAQKSKRSDMSRVNRKPDFCICENKDADQLRGNHEAPLFSLNSTIPLLRKPEISSLFIFCGCIARFMSDLVGNPEDRFSHNDAHMRCLGEYGHRTTMHSGRIH